MTTPKVCPVWVHPSHDLRASPITDTFGCNMCGKVFSAPATPPDLEIERQENARELCPRGRPAGVPHWPLAICVPDDRGFGLVALPAEMPCVCDMRDLMSHGHNASCSYSKKSQNKRQLLPLTSNTNTNTERV